MVKKDFTFFFFGISLLLIVFDYFDWLHPLKSTTDLFIIPVKKSVYQTNVIIRNFGSLMTQYHYIEKTFTDKLTLQKTNEELSVQIRILTEENIKLRRQLEAPLPASFKYIPAKVVGKARFMEIEVGETDGVKAGMTVVDGMVLLGKVVATSTHRSSVMLLSDSEMKVAAKTSRGTNGFAVGNSGQNMTLDKVLQKDPLFIDDQVVTSGEDGFPADLLIGKIVYIKSEDVEVYKQAKIDAPLDYKKENNVLVISTP